MQYPIIDCSLWQDDFSAQDTLEQSLELRDAYGRNLDALYDVLSSGGRQLILTNTEEAQRNMGSRWEAYLEVMQDAGALYRMIPDERMLSANERLLSGLWVTEDALPDLRPVRLENGLLFQGVSSFLQIGEDVTLQPGCLVRALAPVVLHSDCTLGEKVFINTLKTEVRQGTVYYRALPVTVSHGSSVPGGTMLGPGERW